MLYSKRYAEILKIVRARGTTSIHDLAVELGVSLETIRRDVRPLADDGTLVKMHGAVALPYDSIEAPFERRVQEHSAEKAAIAARMAERIPDGASVMMDAGTTTSLLSRELLKRRNLTVVTNSPEIAHTLAVGAGNRVHLAGGEIHNNNFAAIGPSAVEFLKRFRVDCAVITIGAIDARAGLMNFSPQEAEIARTMLGCGSQRFIITDHSKFDRTALCTVGGLDLVDRIVTDEPPSERLAEALRAAGVEIEVVPVGLALSM